MYTHICFYIPHYAVPRSWQAHPCKKDMNLNLFNLVKWYKRTPPTHYSRLNLFASVNGISSVSLHVCQPLFFIIWTSAELLLSEDGGQNISISDAFIKGMETYSLALTHTHTQISFLEFTHVSIVLAPLICCHGNQSHCLTVVWRTRPRTCCWLPWAGTTARWTSSERRTGKRRPWRGCCESAGC